MPPGVAPPLRCQVLPAGRRCKFAASIFDELSRCNLVRMDPEDPEFVVDLRGGADISPTSGGPVLGVWRFEVDRRPVGDLRTACRAALARGAASLTVRLVAVEAGGTGSPTVLREGRLPVSPYSLSRTMRDVTEELSRWPVHACRALVATGNLEGPRGGAEDRADGAGITGGDGAAEGALSVRLAARGACRACRVLFRHGHWNIGVLNVPLHDVSSGDLAGRVCWASEPPRHIFRADPFGVLVDGRPWILYEELDYRTGKGHIVAARWGEDGTLLDRQTVLASEHHLSYPYLIRKENDIYCVPETSEAGSVELYRATDFPSAWEKVTDLIKARAMLDSTLFRYEDRWWLFATDREQGPRHVLTAWHAPSLRGPWKEHAGNPVKVDVHSSRPAGTPFRRNGTLYRPAQDGARRYGGAVVINRVDALTPTRFVEVPVRRIAPAPDGPYPDGVHTLSRLGPHLTLVDGNRNRFSHYEFARRLRGFVRR